MPVCACMRACQCLCVFSHVPDFASVARICQNGIWSGAQTVENVRFSPVSLGRLSCPPWEGSGGNSRFGNAGLSTHTLNSGPGPAPGAAPPARTCQPEGCWPEEWPEAARLSGGPAHLSWETACFLNKHKNTTCSEEIDCTQMLGTLVVLDCLSVREFGYRRARF